MSCTVLDEVFEVIKERKAAMPPGSYVASLFEKGEDRILEKVGEEAIEVILAAKKGRKELIYESADLVFHLMVLLASKGVELSEVYEELRRRRR
ncbi:MAG: phosphoribosyl-ATP diphosphatase [Euryarchaeota archaeon]|nr:phosphoribosyl-ATP diphosphatase [Euryarchaeota archaeon]